MRNLLLGEHHPLRNRAMHISGLWYDTGIANSELKAKKSANEARKVDIEPEEAPDEARKEGIEPEKAPDEARKVDIEPEKAPDEAKKVDIAPEKVPDEARKVDIDRQFMPKTAAHIRLLLDTFGYETVFGRSDIQNALGLKPARCSILIRDMQAHGIIQAVVGQGKGKYQFRRD